MPAPIPLNEAERLEALRSHEILDTAPEEAFDALTRLASHICGTPIALVTLVDAARQWFKSKVGLDIEETPREVAFCSTAILQPDLFVVPDAAGDERFAANPLVTSDPYIRFYAGMPLTDENGFALGTLCVIDQKPRELTPDQKEALQLLARQVLSQIERRRAIRELAQYRNRLEEMVEHRTKQIHAGLKRIELTYDETLEALGGALDLRDNETEGHSRRVTRYCLEIAKSMGCSEEVRRQIARGSYLHDIGKIGIPDAILLKPGKLTDEERQIMETHVRIGYDLVCRIAFLASAAEIVLTHQERYDGLGYPQGLMGKEIPLGARIFAVADTFDAMTSDRPYRAALSFAVAREEITKESGHQFDPDVVHASLSVSDELWLQIRKKVEEQRGTPARVNWRS